MTNIYRTHYVLNVLKSFSPINPRTQMYRVVYISVEVFQLRCAMMYIKQVFGGGYFHLSYQNSISCSGCSLRSCSAPSVKQLNRRTSLSGSAPNVHSLFTSAWGFRCHTFLFMVLKKVSQDFQPCHLHARLYCKICSNADQVGVMRGWECFRMSSAVYGCPVQFAFVEIFSPVTIIDVEQ